MLLDRTTRRHGYRARHAGSCRLRASSGELGRPLADGVDQPQQVVGLVRIVAGWCHERIPRCEVAIDAHGGNRFPRGSSRVEGASLGSAFLFAVRTATTNLAMMRCQVVLPMADIAAKVFWLLPVPRRDNRF